MRKLALWRILLTPWMIIVVLVVGWGPVFVADCVRARHSDPDLVAEYLHFVMQWLSITVLCSVIAGALTLVHGFIFLFRLLGNSPASRK